MSTTAIYLPLLRRLDSINHRISQEWLCGIVRVSDVRKSPQEYRQLHHSDCRNSLIYAHTTSRTLATCDMSLGLPTVSLLEAGDFVESLEPWKDDNETRSELIPRLRIQSIGGNVVVNLTINNLIHTNTAYEHHTLIQHDFLRHSWSFIRPSSGRGCKYIKEERSVEEASIYNPPNKIS